MWHCERAWGIRRCTVSPHLHLPHPPSGHAWPVFPHPTVPAQAAGKHTQHHRMLPPRLTPVLPLCHQLCARPPHRALGFPSTRGTGGVSRAALLQHGEVTAALSPAALRGHRCCCVMSHSKHRPGCAHTSRAHGFLHSGDGSHVLCIPSQTKHRTVLHDQ